MLKFKERVGNCSIEIIKDVNDLRCVSAIWTVEDPNDFMVLTQYGEEIIHPFPTKCISGVLGICVLINQFVCVMDIVKVKQMNAGKAL